ncbi:putative lipase ROG1 isoform X2 [Phoenix dactylifera]|uniref:Lipase ROG1 isoform X2 n=1 Tax=Phoenix dactylifera TaxID=42345 RepID=A0A8B9A212_PHODC|nr:putative lipase ROG1 isoform X2 [Phoenix dactylifera]
MAPAAAAVAVAGEARGGGEAMNGGKRSRRKGRRHSAYLRRLSCFKPAADLPAACGGGDDVEGERRIPTHLVVTVNGIIGSAANWRFTAKQFVKKYPEDVIVLCSECNYLTLTFDGVDVMGERLAEEVISAVARRPELQKISFVGHSLGGLIARYAIGILYGKDVPRNPPEENGGCKTYTSGAQCMEEKLKRKIAGLEPMNFITFATPHLGSRLHKQIPILRGSYALEKMAYHISWIIGRTGKHLFLKDREEGKPPLLLRMVNDSGDLKFMSALQSFKRCVAYSNACYDFIVGWKTSSIRHQDELPKRESFTKNGQYPHVVYVEKPKTAIVQQEDFSETMISQPKSASEMEEAMIKGLTTVPWERVDISFQKSVQKIFAHCTIQVNTYFINSDGADVIFHMIDNFLL